MSRILIFVVAIPLLLVLIAGAAVYLLLDKEKLVSLASDALYKQSGATLEVAGDIGLSLYPDVGVSLAGAGLSIPGEQATEVQLGSLSLGVKLMPLLSGRAELDSIILEELVLRMESAPEEPTIDTSSLSDEELDAFYAKRQQAMESMKESSGQEVLAAPLALNVGLLSITDSRLEISDPDSGETTIVLLDKLIARDLNLDNRPIPLELALTLAGDEPLNIELEGSIAVAEESQTLSLEKTSVIVTGVTPQQVKLTTSGEVALTDQVADLTLAVQIGETRGKGKLRYASFESPQIDANLHFNLLDPALLIVAGPEAAEQADTGSTGEEADQALPLDALRAMDTRAGLRVDRAIFDAHTIEDMKLKLRALNGEIRIPVLTGKLHGGLLDLKATFNARHNVARLNTSGGLKGLDIPTALIALETEPAMGGSASLEWTLNSRGTTVDELIQNLKGPIKLTTAEVVLKEVAVEEMFCQAVALVNQQQLSAEFPADSALEDLSADIALEKGKAVLKPLRIDLDNIRLRGRGNFDLASQDFKATFSGKVSEGLGELDPACRVNQRYTSIEWPVECKGNTSGDPADWCGLDTSGIIEDLAKQEAKRKVEKEAGRLFDKLLNK